MLYYKITEAHRIYYVELIATDQENEWNERYYLQVQFNKADDQPLYESARLLTNPSNFELTRFIETGFKIVNSLSNLDAKALVENCYQVIRTIKAFPRSIALPTDN